MPRLQSCAALIAHHHHRHLDQRVRLDAGLALLDGCTMTRGALGSITFKDDLNEATLNPAGFDQQCPLVDARADSAHKETGRPQEQSQSGPGPNQMASDVSYQMMVAGALFHWKDRFHWSLISSSMVKLPRSFSASGLADHFRIRSAAKLAEAARASGIVVFPGFEAVTKEGVHFGTARGPDAQPPSLAPCG